MQITIKVVPHNEQRYETVGDWWFDNQSNPVSGETVLEVRVSNLGNGDYESLIALHEVAEAILCLKRGIKEKDVTAFDETFEKARGEYPLIFGDSEPGDHPKAPYHNEHLFASRLEQSMAMELGVDWKGYNDTVNAL